MVPKRIAFLALLAFSCGKDKTSADDGLPAASDWNAPKPTSSGASAQPSAQNPHGGMDNPHAQMPAGDPHAGMAMGGGDPHAGMAMGGGDPHAGMAMGGTNTELPALPPPDPNRAIDKNKFVAGRIKTTKKTAGLVKSGAVMFLSVRPIDPLTGDVIGSPLAVDRIDIARMPVSFRLDEGNAMSAGTRFEGDVMIYARVDGDADAITKAPGDVEGSVRVKIPAKDVVLSLDSVIR